MIVCGTRYPKEFVLHRKVKHLSFDARARVDGGCFLLFCGMGTTGFHGCIVGNTRTGWASRNRVEGK